MAILLLEQNILNSTNTTYNSRVLVFLKIYFCFSLVWPLESRFGLSRHIKKVNLERNESAGISENGHWLHLMTWSHEQGFLKGNGWTILNNFAMTWPAKQVYFEM